MPYSSQKAYREYRNFSRRRRRSPLVPIIIILLLLSGAAYGYFGGYAHAWFGVGPEGDSSAPSSAVSGGISTARTTAKPAAPPRPFPYQKEWDDARALAAAGAQFEALVKYGEVQDLGGAETPAGVIDEYERLLSAFYIANVRSADELIRAGAFAEAAELATRLSAFFGKDPRVRNLVFSSANVVKWEGPIEHIFFHPLIVYPERAFPASGSNGQDKYMVTVYEFKRIIEQMYQRGYILIDIETLYTPTFDDAGAVTAVARNELWIPEGKKPFVLSVDDLNYYEYMIQQGQNFKMILDENGEICTWSKDMAGNDVYSYDNEIVTIIDSFIRENPDFSFNNAKGVLALTGYQGVLGWRVNDQPKADNFEEEFAGAREVAAKLKENGWTFASHGQGHRHTAAVAYSLIVEDTDRWEKIVASVVGETSVYVYPYGEGVEDTDPKFDYLKQNGFAMFCGVGMPAYLKYAADYAHMDRKNIDGIGMSGTALLELFDPKVTLDPTRPWPRLSDLP